MKNKTLDVLVKAKDKLINIEVNSEYYESLRYRNSGYIYEKYAEISKAGDDYKDMPDIIQINFTSGLPKRYPPACRYIRFDPDEKVHYEDKLITYEYNIDKIKEMCYNGNKKYDYVAALDFEPKELEKYCEDDEYMEKFKKEVDKLNLDVEFTEYLSAEEDNERVKNTLIAEAREKGEIEGEKNGILTVAKNMLKEKADINFISKTTGLSKEEILALKEN